MSSNNNTVQRHEQHGKSLQHSELLSKIRQLEDEQAAMKANYQAMEQQLLNLSSAFTSREEVQQQSAGVAPSAARSPEVEGVINNIHDRHALFPVGEGYQYDRSFRSAHNEEVTAKIAGYCVSHVVGCTLSPQELRSRIHTYFVGQKHASKQSPEQKKALSETRKRNKRVWKKLAGRKEAYEKHAVSLEAEFPGGSRLLVRECMSPEISDGEGDIQVKRPAHRTIKAMEFLERLDLLVKQGKKREARETLKRKRAEDDEALLPEEVRVSLPDWAK